MGGKVRAFLDASVLYPVSLRSLLMRLTLAKLVRVRWTAKIHEEWIGAVLRDNPAIPVARLHDLRDAMDRRAGDTVLVTGYESLIDGLSLPDPNDRHVLAAAIIGRVSVIVTRNLKDFPDAVLDPYKIQVMNPDQFIRSLLDEAPAAAVEIVRDQQASLINPPVPMPDLLSLFERLDKRETVAELRRLSA
jgi:hypothetical protein